MSTRPIHSSFVDLPQHLVYTTVGGLMVAMFMATLDQTIVATAMPKIIEKLHGFEHYAGVVSAYMVTSTAAMPIAGKISDIYGRKLLLLLGVGLFIFASALCGLAQNMEQLVLFRGLQGIGGGTLQIMAFTTIADLFPPRNRGRVVGVVGSVFALSSTSGPVIGGFLTEVYGWRAIFYVNLPLGFIAFCVLWWFFPQVRNPWRSKPTIDYQGAFFLVAAIVPILIALNLGGRDYPWGSTTILGLFVVGLLCAGVFLLVENHAREPILPLGLFRNPIIAVALAAAAILSACMFGISLFIPLFVQSILEQSALQSGTILIPMTICLAAASIISGQLISKYDRYKPFAVWGTALTALGVFSLAQMDSSTSSALLIFNTALTGIGLGAALPVFNLVVQNAVDAKFVGVATSAVQFVRSIGGCLGVAIFGSILTLEFVPAFHRAIPPEIFRKISHKQMMDLDDPQAFVHPDALAHIGTSFSAFGMQVQEVLYQIKAAAKVGITSALQDVFTCAGGILVLGIILALFLREVPLRRSNRSSNPADTLEAVLDKAG
jgi:EmrB/QacA subfamily drug resistance transporter